MASSSAAASTLSRDEIAKTFAFLDADGQGQVTMATLKKRLGAFFPEMTTKEYRFLMGGRKELTLEVSLAHSRTLTHARASLSPLMS